MKIVPITISEAKKFIAVWHRHNKPPLSAVFAVALKHDDELIGVATAGRPVARMLDDGDTIEVTRTCVRDGSPKGAVSKLLNTCRKVAGALGYRRCVTYTLQRESGASLRGAGWVQGDMLAPRGGWSCPKRLREPGTVDNTAKIRWEVDL